jgi:signal transduction histidine kinase
MVSAIQTARVSPPDALPDARELLARDVHDVVGSAMTAIQLHAQVGLRAAGHRPAEAAEVLRTILAASQRSLAELRSVLRADPGVEAAGLDQLDSLIAVTAAGQVHVDATITGELTAVPAEHSEAAYRIIQESITNAIRHGRSSRIELRLAVGERELAVDVTDDGTAAAASTVAQLPGRGIRGMRERAALLGGTLTARPSPETGFAVHARLPLPGRTNRCRYRG